MKSKVRLILPNSTTFIIMSFPLLKTQCHDGLNFKGMSLSLVHIVLMTKTTKHLRNSPGGRKKREHAGLM